MFSRNLEGTLNTAFSHAKDQQHEFMTVEHLLLALLDDPQAIEVLAACVVNLNDLRLGLENFINETTPRLSVHDQHETQPTLGFQRVLQRAIFQVQNEGKSEVDGSSVLLAIFREQGSQAVQFLQQEGVTRMDVLNYLSRGVPKLQDNHLEMSNLEGHQSLEPKPTIAPIPEKPPRTSAGRWLEQCAVNLNKAVETGDLDPLIGRKQELKRTIQILCRRRKNNPLFVGEAGVGKTAVAEGLARRIVEGKVPDQLSNAVIYSLDLAILLAGTKYRGDFEKRFKEVLKELKKIPGAIVFIDEIHTLIGAGSASGGAIDAANLIKPLLTGGDVRCMGATTYQEYRNIFSKDHALTRRFQKVDIAEPSVEETVEILKGLRSRFESFHHIRYKDEALRAAAELSDRYLTDRCLPDKAIDVVDEVGALQSIRSIKKRKKIIDKHDIEEIIAKIARIPSQQVSTSDRQLLANLEKNLKKQVFGQNEAIESLCSAIKLSRSGLRDPNKPVGSFLFVGPTGVGKTEVTQQLAKEMGVELVRFDMSEYMEPHSVSRLIGSPPGYVGYEEGGLLTEAINKNPHSVLLLDEIEKAHKDIYNLLLQVMDHGTLTDNSGVSADFRHVVVIMTSNVGAELLERGTMGFTGEGSRNEPIAELRNVFTPEFRNRLDATIQFKALAARTLDRVTTKFLAELERQLDTKNVHIDISKAAKNWLSAHGYDERMGARPMARLIEYEIKRPLANELLFGKLMNGGTAKIRTKGSELSVEVAA